MIETRALPSDTDLLALHRLDPLRYPVLLESVASGTAQGRWDFLLVTDGTGLRLDADGITRDLQGNAETGDFLAALDRHWLAERTAWLAGKPASHNKANKRASAASWRCCTSVSASTSRSMSERGNSSPRP